MSKFNLEEAIENYNCSEMLKAGMIYYFTANDIKIKNQKDFDKAVENYLKLNIGA
jgi:hypothetical protein